MFFSTAEEVPGFSDEQRARQARFVEAFAAASPDFQTEHGYAVGRFQDELLTLASKWVAHRFGCVSLTLEMPFKRTTPTCPTASPAGTASAACASARDAGPDPAASGW